MTGSITMTASKKTQSDEIKRQLLVDMQEEQSTYMQKLTEFYKTEDHSKADYIELMKGVIASVDKVLNGCDYESSLFLRNTVKPLKEMRAKAVDILEQIDAQALSEKNYLLPTLEKECVPVYVLMFQSKGHDIENWSQLLRSLGRYVLGRPIYKTEEDVQKVIRAKMSSEHEGYAKVAVSQSVLDSLDELSVRKDRFGNELISLPAGIVSSQHILEFVHGKKRYHFIRGNLIDVSISTERN
ncbi:MAG: Dot/Icm secretion system protein IcmQ [Coxiella sp. (in: Bacteria)]|nr:MAG: Dot/Icm secretion system protein IcmQ [Coxiella sp. (in: g-proteobacteria)]